MIILIDANIPTKCEHNACAVEVLLAIIHSIAHRCSDPEFDDIPNKIESQGGEITFKIEFIH